MGFKRANISEMRAEQEAYGGKLDSKTVLSIIGAQGLIYFGYSWWLFMRLWVAIIVAIIALIISYVTLVRPEVSINYYRHGLEQRNTFLNNMSMSLSSSDNRTMSTNLQNSEMGLYGEFRQDINKLQNTIQNGGHDKAVHQQFSYLRNKYREDTFFVQYMEELENANATGDYDVKTFDELTTYHAKVFDQQQDYISKRKHRLQSFYTYLIGLFIAYAITTAAFGFKDYVALAHSFGGILLALLYLALMTVALHYEYKYYHDESLMTM